MSRPVNPKSISRTRTFEKGESFQEIADFIVKNIETVSPDSKTFLGDMEEVCPTVHKYRIQIIPVREKQMMAY